MSTINSKIIAGSKFVYLTVFFALLAGFFHPLITDTSPDSLISGVLILFVGLVGGVLIHRSATSEKKRLFFFVFGFLLVILSLYGIFQVT